jgi:hypothetical protein
MPPCRVYNPAVGYVGSPPTPKYPELLSTNDFLKRIAELRVGDPTKQSFDIAYFLKLGPPDYWRIVFDDSRPTIFGFTPPLLSSDEAVVTLSNQADGETAITAVSSANCAGMSNSITVPEGMSAALTFNRTGTTTLVFSRNVCTAHFIGCLMRGWQDIAIWSEPNFWAVFGGRYINFTWLNY